MPTDRWAWTSEGAPEGSTFVLAYMPENVKFIKDPDGPWVGANGSMRYKYDEPTDTWNIVPDAVPVEYPADFYAWDNSERYDVNPNDPLRNSWVQKPDAQPVEQPE